MNTHEPEWVALVREKVGTLRFGVVQIVVHDSKVTQIERTEKTRLVSCESEFISNRPDTLEGTKTVRTPHRATGERSS